MRYYTITVRQRGHEDQTHQVTSLLNIKAVLILCYRRFFNRDPGTWWACKNVNMGQAWSRKRKVTQAAREIEISQIHDDEFREMKNQQAAHLDMYGPYLLTERRAA
jgi:hypothetical protein